MTYTIDNGRKVATGLTHVWAIENGMKKLVPIERAAAIRAAEDEREHKLLAEIEQA